MMPAAAYSAARKPRALRVGSRIRLVSPASPVKEADLAPMSALLQNEGYIVEIARQALQREHHLAGPDKERAKDLQQAFEDPDVDGVICTRGGYGCARLFPYLDLDRMARAGKLFLGFSDITTLHIALNRRGLPTVHGPMPLTLSKQRPEWAIESLKRVLKGDTSTPQGTPTAKTLVEGTSEGDVVGGCLCLITDSLGTPEAIDAKGKILLIEDVDEAPHRVDAMLTHLLNAGVLQSAAGMVIGEMTRTDEKLDEGIGGRPWKEIIEERIKPLGIPAVIEFPFGHAAGMLSLPLGIRARLDADEGKLTYLEPLCA